MKGDQGMEEQERQRARKRLEDAETRGEQALAELNESMIAIRAQDQWIREQIRRMERTASS